MTNKQIFAYNLIAAPKPKTCYNCGGDGGIWDCHWGPNDDGGQTWHVCPDCKGTGLEEKIEPNIEVVNAVIRDWIDYTS